MEFVLFYLQEDEAKFYQYSLSANVVAYRLRLWKMLVKSRFGNGSGIDRVQKSRLFGAYLSRNSEQLTVAPLLDLCWQIIRSSVVREEDISYSGPTWDNS